MNTTSYGYARISTLEQNESLQCDALRVAGCERILVDRASGADQQRPQLALLLESARLGDTVVVWRLDRLGRSLRHLIETVEILEAKGVTFRSLTESIDTATPGGRLVFHIFGALAEFERDLIRERTMAGLEAARARGRVGGRPTVWTREKLELATSMYESRRIGVPVIARTLGVSRASVYRALAGKIDGALLS